MVNVEMRFAHQGQRSTNSLRPDRRNFPGLLGYRRDRRVTRIWRGCFGGRGNRENLVLHFLGVLHHDPDRPRFAWPDGLGIHERVPDLLVNLIP